MRAWLLGPLAVLGGIASGCNDVCGSPDQLNGRIYTSMATIRTFEDFEGEQDAFPTESSPANGPVDIGFDWVSDLPEGPLAVTLDGQFFDDGSGQWSQVNCGNFTAAWSGTYEAEDGAEHSFVAGGYFVQFDDQLEGFLDWEERWENPDGRSGRFEGEVLIRGEETR